MASFYLSPPWYIFAKEMQEMFKYDPDVHVIYYEDDHTIKLFVDDGDKAAALDRLIPNEKHFGNVTLSIEVVPANKTTMDLSDKVDYETLFDLAFDNNGVYSFSKTIQGIFVNNLTYVVFRKQVVQYWTDDLSDYYGQHSTLYQEIAKDIFGEREGVFFCTDVEDPVYSNDLDAPLGDMWP